MSCGFISMWRGFASMCRSSRAPDPLPVCPGSETRRPGFGRALDYTPQPTDSDYIGDLYPHPLTGIYINARHRYSESLNSLKPLTLREIAMMQFMNAITDKPDWHKKIFDNTISAEWATEAMASGPFTKKMITWCIEELKFKAKDFENRGFVSTYHGMFKSDCLIPSTLQAALQKAVKPLEEVSQQQKDWHPGSDEKVLDLVQPSLYPLVYGRTRVLKFGTTSLEDCINRCGEGEVVGVPEPGSQFHSKGKEYSTSFQWLPSEIDISGDSARITSYINNLHPTVHSDLYEVINQVITRVLPMWGATLKSLRRGLEPRITYNGPQYELDPRKCDPRASFKEVGPQQRDGEDEYEYEMRRYQWEVKNGRLVVPEPERFVPPQDCTIPSLGREFRSLQIIVKLANIQLTPEKPEYSGGLWHVEGQLNEHICASALYTYSCDNITTSKLAFGQQSNARDLFWNEDEEENHDWIDIIYGLKPFVHTVQVVGEINALEGRVITFPNLLHQQVQPFKLTDPSKPGHRKVLALFLVDPNIKILSTANVPCQQELWRNAAAPSELRERAGEGTEDYPINMEEAKATRLKLLQERESYLLDNGHSFEFATIALFGH